MSEGKAQFASGDFGDEVAPHGFAAAEPDEAAAEHDRGEIRLQHQRAADLLHHDHGLDRPAGRSAMLFGKRQAEQAEVGILLPHDQAPTARFVGVAPARFELVVIGEIPFATMPQQLLLFAQLEIHF